MIKTYGLLQKGALLDGLMRFCGSLVTFPGKDKCNKEIVLSSITQMLHLPANLGILVPQVLKGLEKSLK